MTKPELVRTALEAAAARRSRRRPSIVTRVAVPGMVLVALGTGAAVAAGVDPLELVKQQGSSESNGLEIRSEPVELGSSGTGPGWTAAMYISRDGSLGAAIRRPGESAPPVGGVGGMQPVLGVVEDGAWIMGTQALDDATVLVIGVTPADAKPVAAEGLDLVSLQVADRTLKYEHDPTTGTYEPDLAAKVRQLPPSLELRPFALVARTADAGLDPIATSTLVDGTPTIDVARR